MYLCLYFPEISYVGLNMTVTELIEKVGGINELFQTLSPLVQNVNSRLGVLESRPGPLKGSKGDQGWSGTMVMDGSKLLRQVQETVFSNHRVKREIPATPVHQG